MIKGYIYWKDVSIINTYESKNRALNYMKQKLTKSKKEIFE